MPNWLRPTILLALFVSCQSTPPANHDTLIVGIEAQPEQLDPRLGRDAMSSKIKKLIFPGLLMRDDSQRLKPHLAAKVNVEAGLRYDFTLHDDILFHNGHTMTSADVKATFDSILDPDLNSPYARSFALIDKIETPDSKRVIITLKKPSPSFMTDLVVGILPAEQALAYRDGKVIPQDELIGAGPFRLVCGGLSESRLILEHFNANFDGPAGIKTLEFYVLQDATLRALELLKGRIDLVQNALPAALVPLFQSKSDFDFVSEAGANFNYLAFNFRKPLFQDLKVRQAFAQALDLEGVIKYKLPNLASRSDSLLNPNHWAYHKNLGRYDYDPVRSKILLDEAGYPDPDGDGPKTRFDIVYKTSTDKQRLEIAQIFAANLRAIGIGVEIRSYEFGTFMRDLKQGDFDIATLTWVGISDPDIYYPIAHSGQIPPAASDGLNRGAYKDKRMDDLLEQSRAELDAEKRLVIFGEIQKKFFDDLVYVPLWYEHNFAVMKKNMIGYVPRVDSGFQNLKNVKK